MYMCVNLGAWLLPHDILVAIVQSSICDTQKTLYKEMLLPGHDFLGNLSFRRPLSTRSLHVLLGRVSQAHSGPAVQSRTGR